MSPGAVVRLHMRGFRLGRRRHRRWILAELAAGALWVFMVWYHVAVMAVGQSMTSFFAVWTVHHNCDRSHPAREGEKQDLLRDVLPP